jgi:hypothetical protein
LIHIAQRGNHQHRRHHLFGAQPRHQRQPVHIGQHPVQRNRIKAGRAGVGKRLAPGCGMQDMMTLRAQAIGDHLCHFGIIFHHHYLVHRLSLRPWRGRGK